MWLCSLFCTICGNNLASLLFNLHKYLKKGVGNIFLFISLQYNLTPKKQFYLPAPSLPRPGQKWQFIYLFSESWHFFGISSQFHDWVRITSPRSFPSEVPIVHTEAKWISLPYHKKYFCSCRRDGKFKQYLFYWCLSLRSLIRVQTEGKYIQ